MEDELGALRFTLSQEHLARLDQLSNQLKAWEPGLFSRDPNDPAYSETGYIGDPSLASAEKGKAALAIMTREWLRALRGFAEAPLGSAQS